MSQIVGSYLTFTHLYFIYIYIYIYIAHLPVLLNVVGTKRT